MGKCIGGVCVQFEKESVIGQYILFWNQCSYNAFVACVYNLKKELAIGQDLHFSNWSWVVSDQLYTSPVWNTFFCQSHIIYPFSPEDVKHQKHTSFLEDCVMSSKWNGARDISAHSKNLACLRLTVTYDGVSRDFARSNTKRSYCIAMFPIYFFALFNSTMYGHTKEVKVVPNKNASMTHITCTL